MAEPVAPDSAPYLYLTTIGRKTGQPREIEIWFVAHEGRYYLVAEMREEANWVRNIAANPAVRFRLADRETGPAYEGSGRAVDPAAEPALTEQVRSLMDAKYNWSDGLIVELTPHRPMDT